MNKKVPCLDFLCTGDCDSDCDRGDCVLGIVNRSDCVLEERVS